MLSMPLDKIIKLAKLKDKVCHPRRSPASAIV
jgi:hypothetical protein